MTEVDPSELRLAVERTHGGTATYVQSVPLREKFEGKTAWEGVVAIFDLADNPHATRAYAWAQDRPDGKQQYVAVLHMGPVTGPVEAVRAAIVAERRSST